MKLVPIGGRLCLWLGTSLAVCGPAFARECATFSIEPLAGVERSRWHESDASGAGLVEEEGNLAKIGIEASLICERSEWDLRWARSEGRRTYEGVTNTQAPVETVTDVRADEFSLIAMRLLDEQVSIGLRAEHRNIHRSIRSTGVALGYPERFRYWSVAAGARYRHWLGEQRAVSMNGWVGGGPGGRLWIDLPRADPVELRLGNSRMLELGLQFESVRPQSEPRGWSWSAGLTYRVEVLGAGDPQVVFRGSVPVGVAAQPRTTQTSVGFFAKATLMF